MQSASLGTNGTFVRRVGLDLTDTESSGFAFAHAVRVAQRIAQSRLQVVYVRDKDSTVAAQVIVVGGREIPHLKAIFLGSAAERPCPVLVAEPRPKRTPSSTAELSALRSS